MIPNVSGDDLRYYRHKYRRGRSQRTAEMNAKKEGC